MINSVIETCGFIPVLWECWVIFKAKTSTGSALSSRAYWTAAGVWWLFYYNQLEQFWTMASIGLWLCCYSLKTFLVFKYRKNSKVPVHVQE